MWTSFVLAFAATVAASDAYWRRIPLALTICGWLAGLAYHIFYGGFWSALLTSCLGFTASLALFELRALGGGDVKLVTALGAILGFQHWLRAIEVAIGVAGAMALAGVVHRRRVLETFRNVGRLLGHFAANGFRPHPQIHVQNQSLVRVPFGVAAALGTVWTVVAR
jgi:prepilin peptidase CpaA